MKTSDAVKHYRSKVKLAELLGITPSAITQWGEDIPLLRQYQLQTLSGGVLTAEVIHPQLTKTSSQESSVGSRGLDGSVCLNSVLPRAVAQECA